MVAAVSRTWPGTVFTGAIAARLSYWPTRSVPVVTAASQSARARQRGLQWERRTIPPELRSHRGRLVTTTPSLTALDLSDLDHTEALDVALRRRVVTLDSLREALRLAPHRRGNTARWAVVVDSRDGAWSYPERLGHRLLRAASIRGWKANFPFVEPAGLLYYIDIAFRACRLAIEIDGRVHAEDPDVFESDRWRQNALMLSGWRVLRFTYRMMVEHPEEFIRAIRAALP